jgi:hypothetical protein
MGFIATNYILNQSGARGALFILSPYIVMSCFAAWINYEKTNAASNISVFIAASLVCVFKVNSYYQAAFHPTSSTEGLIFLVMPLVSIALFLGAYVISYALIRIKIKKQEESLLGKKAVTVGLVSLSLLIIYGVYRVVRTINFRKDEFSWQQTSTTNGDVIKARKLGVYVKDLHYKVDSFNGTVKFNPYIEKVFQYGDRNEEIETFEDIEFPYAVSYQTEPVKGAIVLIKKGQERNVRDRRYVLREPKLKDTIFLQMKREGLVLGNIKVWD